MGTELLDQAQEPLPAMGEGEEHDTKFREAIKTMAVIFQISATRRELFTNAVTAMVAKRAVDGQM